MKVRVIKPTRIERAKAGETVEVSPDRAHFLLRYGLAEPVSIREQIVKPEEPRILKNKTTRKLKK